jgi:hypothetical protein
MRAMIEKLVWEGMLYLVQPRIRLLRSFDERSHSYLGYVLGVRGSLEGESTEFQVAIGKSAQAKYKFRYGDFVRGASHPVPDKRLETADYYKTSGLKLVERTNAGISEPPPWVGVPPDLEVYRERGHRRLHANIYAGKCLACIWGCRMPVEIIVDHWKPDIKRYRFETFCYGPKSCAMYLPGPKRKVPGRRGMTWVEEDWVDEAATAHRESDE